MAKRPLYVIRVGGSVITDRTSYEPKFDEKNTNLFANEILRVRKNNKVDIIITHGMGSCGHPIAKKYNIHKRGSTAKKIHGIILLQKNLQKLNETVVKHFVKQGLPAMSYQPYSALVSNKHITRMSIEPIKRHLNMGMIPIVFAGPVPDKSRGVSILSSDHIGPYLAKELKADLFVAGTCVDGVHDKDPYIYKDARQIPKITPKNYAKLVKSMGGSTHIDVTGGMLRKVDELLNFAKCGVKARVVDLRKPNVLYETIQGIKQHGTLITK